MIKHSPGVSKAGREGSYSSGTPQAVASYNISGMGDDGTGHMQFNFTNYFSSGTFAAVLTPTSGTPGRTSSTSSGAVGSIDGWVVGDAGTSVDLDFSLICMGDQ